MKDKSICFYQVISYSIKIVSTVAFSYYMYTLFSYMNAGSLPSTSIIIEFAALCLIMLMALIAFSLLCFTLNKLFPSSSANDENAEAEKQNNIQNNIRNLKELLDPREKIELTDMNQQQKVTLDDVIVEDEIKKELQMICTNMSEDKKSLFEQINYKPPRGYILHGPPGTGKTLLARAVACEANANFINVSGSQCMQRYSGQSAHYIHDLFKKARENAPCIIFIDEIDSVCGKRNNDTKYSSTEGRRIVNQFLHEVDGFNSSEGVTVIAATNDLNSLDDALIRSGRLSEHIHIPLPDKDQREKILDLYMKNSQHAVDFGDLADVTEGFSGADLESLVNQAKRNAVNRVINELEEQGKSCKDAKVVITREDFNSTIAKLKTQKEESKKRNFSNTQPASIFANMLPNVSNMSQTECTH